LTGYRRRYRRRSQALWLGCRYRLAFFAPSPGIWALHCYAPSVI
jgi:hypothetical protein